MRLSETIKVTAAAATLLVFHGCARQPITAQVARPAVAHTSTAPTTEATTLPSPPVAFDASGKPLNLPRPWKDGKHPAIDSIAGVDAPAAPFRTAEEELKTFHLPPSLRAKLVAAEPMVEVPVVINFDADGRLWIAEMRGYMRDAAGSDEDKPSGRIVILEDTDGDGRIDKRTVFADGLVMPRAVLPAYDGALVAAPPRLWFMRDTNGDGAWDFRIEIATDYGKKGENPEHMANGLTWGMDNWIHSANYGRAFRRVNGKWESRKEPVRGQWGFTQDDWARTFHNGNSDYFRGDLVPAEYSGRNRNAPDKLAGVNVAIDANQEVFSGRVNFATNRAYTDNYLRPDGTLKNFTAACSPMIYRGGLFPSEFDGNCFVCEPSANVIRRSVFHENGNILSAENAYKTQHTEFLWSDDERFRPVDLKTGPDGAIYVLDMYRGIIQHKGFLTPYLKQLLLMRGMDQPFETGRIWRIVPSQVKPPPVQKLSKMEPTKWLDHLPNSNGIIRDSARRLIVERADSSDSMRLKKIIGTHPDPRVRVQALWTLKGLNQDVGTVFQDGIASDNPHVRAAAIRVLDGSLAKGINPNVLDQLLSISTDSSPIVRLQFGFTVSGINDPRAINALAQMLSTGEIDRMIREAAVNGLQGREWDLLKRLLDDPKWRQDAPGRGDMLGLLVACVLREGKADRVSSVLDLCVSAAAGEAEIKWRGVAMLEGMRATIARKGQKVKTVTLNVEPEVLNKLNDAADERVKSAVPVIQSVLFWPGKPVPPKKVPPPLTPEQEARLVPGKRIYQQICAACHQQNGEGLEGKAPALAGSTWVTGNDRRLTRIILHGARGPITVNGETIVGEMPAMSTLPDDQIAAILTYIRRSWDNAEEAVEPATVARVRDETQKRSNPWTEAELLKVP